VKITFFLSCFISAAQKYKISNTMFFTHKCKYKNKLL
jgi:hypothetical protein